MYKCVHISFFFWKIKSVSDAEMLTACLSCVVQGLGKCSTVTQGINILYLLLELKPSKDIYTLLTFNNNWRLYTYEYNNKIKTQTSHILVQTNWFKY